MKFRTVFAAALMLLAGLTSSAQTKSEIKQYGKAVKAGTVAAYDKFLGKFPASVYAEDISARKDTLLSISPYGFGQARAIASEFMGSGAEFRAFATRTEGVDRVYALAIEAEGLSTGSVRLVTLCAQQPSKKGAGPVVWEKVSEYDQPAFENEEMVRTQFVDSCHVVRIRQKEYFLFNCLLSSEDGSRQIYGAASYCPADESFGRVAFSGKNIRTAKDDGLYRIQGRQDLAMQSGSNRPEMLLMSQQIAGNPLLVAVSDEDYLTDEAMQFWLKNNPDALTSATKVAAATLPAASSLVKAYEQSKGKKSNSKYSAGMFDFRGYTVIVVYQKASSDYILLWVEPECKDHNRDRLLNSISFTGDTTLEMFYYHGSRTFKYHLNVASKSLQRK